MRVAARDRSERDSGAEWGADPSTHVPSIGWHSSGRARIRRPSARSHRPLQCTCRFRLSPEGRVGWHSAPPGAPGPHELRRWVRFLRGGCTSRCQTARNGKLWCNAAPAVTPERAARRMERGKDPMGLVPVSQRPIHRSNDPRQASPRQSARSIGWRALTVLPVDRTWYVVRPGPPGPVPGDRAAPGRGRERRAPTTEYGERHREPRCPPPADEASPGLASR